MKAPYVGFINPDMPTFGDIAVLAKGKLKKNANETFSFEQINERCDEKCQINADKYLENVTALWMVERIRHRDDSGNSHRYDLKFTIVPIYYDQKTQIDHNILENRLRNHMKRTFILRDTDYPKYFKPSRRTDLFSPGFERSFSNFMNNPNSLMQNFLGLSPPKSSTQNNQKPHKHHHKKDNRLNTGEFYMAPKIINTAKTHFHPTEKYHVLHQVDQHVRFPDSREMTVNKHQSQHQVNLYRPKPEIYNHKNIIDYRGANDNVFVGSSDHQLTQPNNHITQPNYQFSHQNSQLITPNHQLSQHQLIQPNQQFHQPSSQPMVPVFSIPVDMPLIQLAQAPYAFPFQIQLSSPANQPLFPQQHEVTTFRYQPQLIGLSNHPQQPLFNQYVPISFIPSNKSKIFQESERHTMNYYSLPDPVYHHQQSTTEAPIQPTTYSPRFNNYANILRLQTETAISTASSIQVNAFDDNEFQPVTPSYDIRKHNHFKSGAISSTTEKPDSINAQLYETFDVNENFTIPYVTLSPLPAQVTTNGKSNEVNYQIVMGRPKLSTQRFNEKTSEKPVLKWIPKKQRKMLTNVTTTSTPASQNSFVPTLPPNELVTPSFTRSTTHIFRGRNRFNKRNSSTNARAATSPPQISTKLTRKKSTTFPSTLASFIATSIFPTYITPINTQTEEPITLQSLSTSISLEVNGERVFDPTTTAGYELVSAGVESIATNNTNVKLFKASVVPEKFDDLTFSILKHASDVGNKDEP